MGKEWWYRSGGGGERKRERSIEEEGHGGKERTASGCMCNVFQFFHSQYPLHHFSLHHQQQQSPSVNPHHHQSSFLPPELIDLKGVETPRNSLELKQPFKDEAAPPLFSTIIEKENSNIQMGIAKIKTRSKSQHHGLPMRTISDDYSSGGSISSPGSKTPNLVARLMGLDLLPAETAAPPTSNPLPKSHLNTKIQCLEQDLLSNRQIQTSSSRSRRRRQSFYEDAITGTHSLPETPRISMSSGGQSDVDYHHRLSLEINKENTGDNCLNKVVFSNYSDSNKTSRREHVSRRRVVGLDTTNTVDTEMIEQDRAEKKIIVRKHRRCQSLKLQPPSLDNEPNYHWRPSSSEDRRQLQNQSRNSLVLRKCKKRPAPAAQTTTDHMIRRKQEEPFVRVSEANKLQYLSDKKCKKTPLSRELFSVKKETSTWATVKLPQKQQQTQVLDVISLKSSSSTQCCRSLSRSYQQERSQLLVDRGGINRGGNIWNGCGGNAATTGGPAEFQYVSRILKRTGIVLEENNSLMYLSRYRWYSPSSPLDPSIFYRLELLLLTSRNCWSEVLIRRWNRKLLFELVNELLAEILNPRTNRNWLNFSARNQKHIGGGFEIDGSDLINALWQRIRSFPSANCQVLEDIDALIENDLGKAGRQPQRSAAFEEVGEGLVAEIEREITEILVHETAVLLLRG